MMFNTYFSMLVETIKGRVCLFLQYVSITWDGVGAVSLISKCEAWQVHQCSLRSNYLPSVMLKGIMFTCFQVKDSYSGFKWCHNPVTRKSRPLFNAFTWYIHQSIVSIAHNFLFLNLFISRRQKNIHLFSPNIIQIAFGHKLNDLCKWPWELFS